MSFFDDTLAALLLVREAFETGDHEQLMASIDLLFEETSGVERLSSREREYVFRDAAIREACRRGDTRAVVAARYGLSSGAICRIACDAGYRLRRERRKGMGVVEAPPA